MFDAMATASWVAANTARLSIGHLVLCDAFRHPAVLAREIVSLDHASGGRVELGIGSGSVFDRPLPPPIAGQDLLPEWVQAMRQMALSHVNFYVIDPSGLGMARVDGGEEGFARETGGHAFLNTNDLDAAATRILRESASFYMVEVPDPPVGGKADLRELNLKSLRKGVTVRARHAIPGGI